MRAPLGPVVKPAQQKGKSDDTGGDNRRPRHRENLKSGHSRNLPSGQIHSFCGMSPAVVPLQQPMEGQHQTTARAMLRKGHARAKTPKFVIRAISRATALNFCYRVRRRSARSVSHTAKKAEATMSPTAITGHTTANTLNSIIRAASRATRDQ